jgi:DNA replication protein DnaC
VHTPHAASSRSRNRPGASAESVPASDSRFRLVSYRYGRGSILITTNKGIADWPEVLAGDEVLATAILDRLLHHSQVLNISGRSYRDLPPGLARALC